jgi:hypothetical protein
MARCLAAAGVTRADVIQITPSFGLFTGGFGFHYGAERIGAMVVPVGAGRTLLQLKLMRELRATVLAAIATYPLRLVEVARAAGADAALIDGESELPPGLLDGHQSIGLTAGASTPEELVQAVLAQLASLGFDELADVTVAREDVHFRLPREVAS